jgi:hypothetical protein
MFVNTTYTSLGISPNADGIVMQTVYETGHRHFAFITTFADIDSVFMGALLLTGLKAYFPAIEELAHLLIPKKIRPLTVHIPDHSGRKRDPHLRIHVINDARSLVVRRFNKAERTSDQALQVMLGPLLEFGPETVSDYVGRKVLTEMAAIHPDVFETFPALLDNQSR